MALYVALKISRGQLEDARYEVRKYKHKVKQRAKVDKADAQIESDTDARTQEIAESIEQGKPVPNLEKPNQW